MNLARAFVDYLEDVTATTFGQDIFLGGAPLDADDAIWWVTANGGTIEKALQTGENLKSYQFNVYYRDLIEQNVYDKLQDLEETINSDGCTQLDGYDTIDLSAGLLMVDQDIDDEDRKVGLLQVNIRIHKE
jgi:hypothetical protein